MSGDVPKDAEGNPLPVEVVRDVIYLAAVIHDRTEQAQGDDAGGEQPQPPQQ